MLGAREIVIFLSLALMFLSALFIYVARRVEGRSALSKLAEWLLWLFRDKGTDLKAVDFYLEEARPSNTSPYELPLEKRLNNEFKVDRSAEMDVVRSGNMKKSSHVVLYLHGGSYVKQATIVHWNYLDSLIDRTGAAVVAPLYPRLPTFTASDAYDKLLPFYLNLTNEISKIPNPPELILMGDSAGGGLALGLSLTLRDMKEKDPSIRLPKHIVLISPWLDITMSNPELVDVEDIDPMLTSFKLREIGKRWVGGLEDKDNLVSPLFASFIGLPDVLLYVGTHELFLPDVRLLKKRLEADGVTVKYLEAKKMNHIYPLYPIPEAKIAQDLLVETVFQKDDLNIEQVVGGLDGSIL